MLLTPELKPLFLAVAVAMAVATAMAAGIAAFHRGTAVGHVEAGVRAFGRVIQVGPPWYTWTRRTADTVGRQWMPTGPGLNPAQGPAVAMVMRGHGWPMKGFRR